MKYKQQLQVIAKKHYWTLCELTLDRKMIEANQMIHQSTYDKWVWLKVFYGNGMKVYRRLKALCILVKYKIPEDTVRKELKYIGKRYGWLLDELITDCKEIEAVALFKQREQMLSFLLAEFTEKELTEVLIWLVLHQQEPRKLLHIINSSPEIASCVKGYRGIKEKGTAGGRSKQLEFALV